MWQIWVQGMISPLNLGDGTKQRLTDDGEALQANFPSLKLPGLDSPAKSRLRCTADISTGHERHLVLQIWRSRILHAYRVARLSCLVHATRPLDHEDSNGLIQPTLTVLLMAPECCCQVEYGRGASSAIRQTAGEGCSGGRSQRHAHPHLPDHRAAGTSLQVPPQYGILKLSMGLCCPEVSAGVVKEIFCVPTVFIDVTSSYSLKCVAAVQGIVGSTPWNAMVFFTLWLQLLGFSDFGAALLMAVFAGGCAIGSLIGGNLGAMTMQHY